LTACRCSQVPSLEPPSTMITLAGASVCVDVRHLVENSGHHANSRRALHSAAIITALAGRSATPQYVVSVELQTICSAAIVVTSWLNAHSRSRTQVRRFGLRGDSFVGLTARFFGRILCIAFSSE
jgi:hypothetical protein